MQSIHGGTITVIFMMRMETRSTPPHNNSKFGYDLWSEGPDKLDPSDNIDNWSRPRY